MSPGKQTHRRAKSSSKVTNSSNIIVSSDTQSYSKPESDDDIEVFGPFPDHVPNLLNHETKENSKRANWVVKPNVPTHKLHNHVFSAQPLHTRPNSHTSVRSVAAFGTSASSGVWSSIPSLVSPVPDIAGLTIARAPVAKQRKRMKVVTNQAAFGDLPIYSYKNYTDPKPHVVYTTDESEADDLVGALGPGPVAFDMEWQFYVIRNRNMSNKLVERRTAVVQIADSAGLILVIQVYGMNRFPKQLQALIENPNVVKLGVNILNDGKKLFRDYGILAKNLVELGAVALVADPATKSKRKIVSLAKLTARYCNKLLDKEERASNWEAPLDQQQCNYAANDVHSAIMIHQRLLAVAQEQSVKLPVLTTFSADVEPYFDSPALSRTSSTASNGGGGASISQDALDVMEMRPQYLRAYRYWYHDGMDMDEMCVKLSLKGTGGIGGVLGEGLKVGTVITYIISALQANSKLPFEMLKLRDLVQMDGSSWVRHRAWILTAWSEGLGVQPEAAEVETEDDHETKVV